MKIRFLTFAVICAPMLAIGAPFENGSFELPGLTTTSTQLILTGNELQGWTKSGPGNVRLLNGRVGAQQFDPVDGVQQLNFNGGDTPTGAVMTQMFDTVPGATYEVSFYVGRVGGGGSVGITARVHDAAANLLSSITIPAPSSQGYGPLSRLAFTAATATTRLSFEDSSAATNSVDVSLDGVSVDVANRGFALGIGLYAALEIEGPVGSDYRIEFTESLAEPTNWLTLTTLQLTASPFLFVDPNSKGRPKRFYRIVPLE